MELESLSLAEQQKIKQSYFNLLALFLSEPQVASRYARCFVKWSVQMQISEEDIVRLGKDLVELTYQSPKTEEEKLKSVFHLVFMIYLDRVIEDDELEVAMAYAERIGLKRDVVPNFFQSIATASADGISPESLEKELIDFVTSSKS